MLLVASQSSLCTVFKSSSLTSFNVLYINGINVYSSLYCTKNSL